MDERKKELSKMVDSINSDAVKSLVLPLIDEMLYLENELDKVKQLPFISYNKTNRAIQKILPAQKVYTSLMQQYNNIVKNLSNIMIKQGVKNTSPLRAYLEKVQS